MTTLRKKLMELDTDAAMHILADARSHFFRKVAELRTDHLKVVGKLSDKTRDSYAADARRVVAGGGNPVTLAGTAASFRKLKAACIWKAREDLRECLSQADRARKRDRNSDIEALCIYDEKLPLIEHRIAYLASLRFNPAKALRRDKTHMQRHKLGRLPTDWISRVHVCTRNGKYGEAVAVGILIPVRAEELANRIRVTLEASGALTFEVKGSKLRDRGSGIASHIAGIGQPMRWLTLSAVDLDRQDTFDWLRDRVIAAGGVLNVGKGLSASGICSGFRSMSHRLFERFKSPPSFYALRHAACSELKSSQIGIIAVAQGMGHSSVLSQKTYGMRSQGSGKYKIKTAATNQVRVAKLAKPPPSASRKLTKAEANFVCKRTAFSSRP